WGVIRNPERYRCAASFAGVTDWDKQLAYQTDFLEGRDRPAWRQKVRGTDRRCELDTVSPARNADKLTRPILLAHGRKDDTVLFSQFDIMRTALQKAGNAQPHDLVLD